MKLFSIGLLMKFKDAFIYRTPLLIAVERGDAKTVKLLLEQPSIDVNAQSI